MLQLVLLLHKAALFQRRQTAIVYILNVIDKFSRCLVVSSGKRYNSFVCRHWRRTVQLPATRHGKDHGLRDEPANGGNLLKEITRRDFLKASGAGIGGSLLIGALHSGPAQAGALKPQPEKKKSDGTTTICPYCASGCGLIVASENGQVVNVEGDPDHPINRGAICAKGASLRQAAAGNPRRLRKVLYRAPGGDQWQEKSWDWALDQIAARIKNTRDANWIEKDDAGRPVNRCEAVASLGGAALDNEECYLLVKMLRSLGMVYIEHQARI